MILEEIVDFLDIALNATGRTYDGIRVCELGNQLMKWNEFGTGKAYLLSKGVGEHISIDWNGKNGALKLDLSKPITQWAEYFDLVTDFGTCEHVEGGIYQAYKNVHGWTKTGGAMIHVGPLSGQCPWHSPYHYELWFFHDLAARCGYGHVTSQIRIGAEGRRSRQRKQGPLGRALLCSVFVKKPDSLFISESDFNSIAGIEGL